MEPMAVQTGIAAPFLIGLIAYVARAREAGPVQRHLLWLLVMILCWTVGLTLDRSAHLPQAWISALVALPACFMAPAFLVIMLHLVLGERFVVRRGATFVVMLPFVFFLAAFLTHDRHGWMAPATTRAAADDSIGPLFWVFQVWSNLAALGGLGLCVYRGLTTPSRSERRRMALLLAGVLLPLVSHLLYTFHLLPLDYPVTPLALAATSLLLVAAIGRFRLFEVKPIARHDVVEGSPDGVLVADVDEVVIDLNPAAVALLGTAAARIRGRPLSQALAALDSARPAGAVRDLLAGLRRAAGARPIEVDTADGRTLELIAGSPRQGRGRRAGSFVVLRDRTSERRAERLLLQSQKLESVGILAAGVAHEVNNPLSFVRANLAHLQGIAEDLQEVVDGLPKALAADVEGLPEVVDDSIAGLDRIHGIVQGLLRLSRPPQGARVLCDVNDSVVEAVRYVKLDRAGPTAVETQLADDLPVVLASPDQLVQVVLNLLLNARHALAAVEAPRIVASTARVDDHIEIRVADNGPGVPEAIRTKIFDPFFTTGGPDEGTGLGLAIAYDIVREHGGILELELPPGGGACFVARLPVSMSPEGRSARGWPGSEVAPPEAVAARSGRAPRRA
jgi:PAS domain S-box-containing protein